MFRHALRAASSRPLTLPVGRRAFSVAQVRAAEPRPGPALSQTNRTSPPANAR